MDSEFMCFNQDAVIFTLNGKHLKIVDQFIYLGSDISSTESDVNIHIGEELTAIDRILTISKSDLG